MWWNLMVFAVIGIFAGAAVRLFYPRREPLQVAGTMALATVGSLLGGMLSWSLWAEVDGQFTSGALLMSLAGAGLVLVVWAGLAYARRVSGRA